MPDERIEFAADGVSRFAGMGDYTLTSPDGRHEVVLRYAGEPPHGDSFHEATIDGRKLPGLTWGSNFAFSADSGFLAASWMAERYERRTIVVDLRRRLFFVLPVYICDFAFHWPELKGAGADAGLDFRFEGAEAWTPF